MLVPWMTTCICRMKPECLGTDCSNCENEPGTKWATSPVDDGDVLMRQVFSPIDLDGDNNLLPAALSDAFSSKGLSVNRKCLPETGLDQQVAMLSEKGERIAAAKRKTQDESIKHAGYCEVVTRSVRAILVEQKQALKVLSTATKKDTSHADIFTVELDPDYEEKIKVKLVQAFSVLVPS